MTFDREGPLSAESEQDLMRQLVAGEEDAIRALYARFGRSVYTVGLRLLGSSEEAEELTQDVFMAAWRKGARFDAARGRLSTWLMAIAHNMAVDRLRHERGAARPDGHESGNQRAGEQSPGLHHGLVLLETVTDRRPARV